MRHLPALLAKELRSHFVSPVAYIVMTVFLVFNGIAFFTLVKFMSTEFGARIGGSVMQVYFQSIFVWLALLMVGPVLTMRLFAQERDSGTIEVLLTAPVSDAEVVLAKYLSALAFFIFLWLPSGVYLFILEKFGEPDFGPIWGGYLGTLLVGMTFLAIGLLMSSLTRNQVVAAVAAFVTCAVLFFLGFLEPILPQKLQGAFRYVSMLDHFDDFSRGVVSTSPLVYYLSLTALALFVTTRVVESRKWR